MDKYEEFHLRIKKQVKLIKDNNFTYRLIIPIIKKYLKKTSDVLDIGCGAGTLVFYVAAKGNNVVGIDISKSAIEACRASARSLKLEKRTKFFILDFPNKSINTKFDLVILTEVIEHIKNERYAIKEINKLLKKKGILILSTPSKKAPLHKLGLLRNFDKKVGHLRRYDLQDLVTLIEKEEFQLLETKKVEGIIRNFLFTNDFAGNFIRLINRFYLSNLMTSIDNISLKLFGESNVILVFKKL